MRGVGFIGRGFWLLNVDGMEGLETKSEMETYFSRQDPRRINCNFDTRANILVSYIFVNVKKYIFFALKSDGKNCPCYVGTK